MIQTNLREIDCNLDPERLVDQLKSFNANVLLLNVGGIVAFYPTELPLHHRDDFLKDGADMVGAVLETAHRNGIKVVGRFDLSKCHREVYEAHPDWFWVGVDGRPVVYNGLYHTCINGGWYREYSHEILKEALGKYDLDGIFFNMFGYQVFDYSGNYHGICQCPNCKARFKEMFGKELPRVENWDDPVYREYITFKDRTVDEVAHEIYRTVKDAKPNIVTMMRLDDTDVIRMEVNRAVDRELPEWAYWSGEQAKWAHAIGKGKNYSSAVVYFIDIPYRFAAESEGCLGLRLAQQLANGASLDFYVLGTLDQEDQKGYPIARKLFNYHANHEDDYAGLRSIARVGLLNSSTTSEYYARREGKRYLHCFRGAYQILAENHIPFDIISEPLINERDTDELVRRYDVMVLPNVACLSDEHAALLDRYVEAGGGLVATYETALFDETGAERPVFAVKSLPVERVEFRKESMRSAYLRVGEGELPGFENTRLVLLDEGYLYVKTKDGAESSLRLIPPQRYGPPEKCYPDLETDWPGIIWGRYGKGRVAYIPWKPDRLYYRHGLVEHSKLLVTAIDRVNRSGRRQIVTNAPPHVEVTIHQRQQDGNDARYVLHLVNFSGNRGTAYHDPIPIHDIHVEVALPGQVSRARLSVLNSPVSISEHDGRIAFDVPKLGLFEAVVFE